MFQEPVRKIGLSNRSITGRRPSTKTGTSHQFESSLERDFLTLIEFDNQVERYVVQPVTIKYLNQDKLRRYTPDMAVYYKPESLRKPLLAEIKYKAELQEKKDQLEPKFTAAKQYCFRNGFEFKVFTEKEIRTDYLQNVKFLSNYRNKKTDMELADILMTKLNDKPFIVEQLISSENEKSKGRMLYVLWVLLANRILTCDMNIKISMQSNVWNQQEK